VKQLCASVCSASPISIVACGAIARGLFCRCWDFLGLERGDRPAAVLSGSGLVLLDLVFVGSGFVWPVGDMLRDRPCGASVAQKP